MKLGILTIQSVNYGNRLQNYALQHVLENYGYQVESLRRDGSIMGPLSSKVKYLKQCLGLLKHINDRNSLFREFNNRYINFSNGTATKEFISPGLLDSYSAFIIGSDQVWNPDFTFNSEFEYLPMVAPEKKIAYAASFGVSSIVSNRDETARLLNGIRSISVRESAGSNIVCDLTGRDVAVVLDPTLLLDSADWEAVSVKPKGVACDQPYLFKYVLGNDINNARIEELAASFRIAIIDVMDKSLNIGPSEFVWLISHSDLVCTDSFHASVFALLHHKPLAIFERVSTDADMSSRFDTLCSNFGLNGHRSSESSFGPKAIFSTDWDDVDARLAILRESSNNWLASALEGVARD